MSTDNSNRNTGVTFETEQEMYAESLTEQRQIRREKLKELQDAGRNPYLQETWDVTAHSKDIRDNFVAMEGEEVSVAGRIMSNVSWEKLLSLTFRTSRDVFSVT